MTKVFKKATSRVSVTLRLSDDRLKLFLAAEPVDISTPLERAELLTLVKEFSASNDVNIGVIDDIVRLINLGEKVEERRIVAGKPAEQGADGKLLVLVKPFGKGGEIKTPEKERTNFAELHLFDNIRKEQVVARIYPPHSGTEGVDALGQKIPAKPGKPIAVKIDSTLEVQKSEHSYEVVRSREDGVLIVEDLRLRIDREINIQADVDYHFGSIDFVGKVCIRGDVLPGFNISAAQGIEIHGSVRGGSLISSGGDIVVKGFVYGGKSSRVISGKSFEAAVVQEVNAQIQGPIRILKEANDSTLRTEASLDMKKGHLMGGRVYTTQGGEFASLGNGAGKATELHFCSAAETHFEYAKFVADIEHHDEAIRLLELHLGPYAKHPQRVPFLNEPYRTKMQLLLTKLEALKDSRSGLQAKQALYLRHAKMPDTVHVNILDTAHEGVTFIAGEASWTLLEAVKGPKAIEFTTATNTFAVCDAKPLPAPPEADRAQPTKSTRR